MATYREVQSWVRERYGFVPKTCWIAHCKELNGLGTRPAPNRTYESRKHPCPPDKRPAIQAALRSLGELK